MVDTPPFQLYILDCSEAAVSSRDIHLHVIDETYSERRTTPF